MLTEVISQLIKSSGEDTCAAARALAAVAPVSKRFKKLSSLDVFWKPLALRRWRFHSSEDAYTASADSAEQAAMAHQASCSFPPGALPAQTWRSSFREREKELVFELPVFFMGTDLWPARPIGLHLVRGRFARAPRWPCGHRLLGRVPPTRFHPRHTDVPFRPDRRSLSHDTGG